VAERAGGVGIFPKLDSTPAGISDYNYMVKDTDGKFKAKSIIPQLVRGTPAIGLMTLDLDLNLDGSIFPGYLIDISNIYGNSNPEDGTAIVSIGNTGDILYYDTSVIKYGVLTKYMISAVMHVGDNYGEEWITRIQGIVPTTGSLGDEEKGGG
jgi:hypothetical protein